MKEKNGLYEAVVTEEKKIFIRNDDIIDDMKNLFLLGDQEEEKKGLSNIMTEINKQDQTVKDYVAGLGLEEA